MKRLYYSFIVVSLSLGIMSCKSTYTKIGSKNANYIPYYLKVYEADSLFIVGNYHESYKILDNLFKKFEPLDMDIYYEYKTFIKCKHKLGKQIVRRNFERLILEFGHDTDQIMYDEDLKSVYLKLEITDVEYNNLRKKYLSGLNLKLRHEIISMVVQDQKFRVAKRSDEDKKNQKKIDSINGLKLVDIFEKIGFPGRSVVGGFNIDNTPARCQVILLHTKDSIRLNYFAPKIKEFISNGTAVPDLYGSLINQYYLYKGQEQYYGTYNNEPINSITTNELNKRRKSIALPSYTYEDWRLKQLEAIKQSE